MIISIKSVGMQASKKNECTFHHPRQCLCWNGTILSHYACKNARHCIVCNTTSLFMKSGLHNNNHSGSINSKRYTHHHTVAASRAGAHVFNIPPNALLAFSVYFILQHRCRCCRRFASARAHTHTPNMSTIRVNINNSCSSMHFQHNTCAGPFPFGSTLWPFISPFIIFLLLCFSVFFLSRRCVCVRARPSGCDAISIGHEWPIKNAAMASQKFCSANNNKRKRLAYAGLFCDAARQWGRRAMRIKVALT